MKLTIDKSELTPALAGAASVTPRRTEIPIVGNVKISAESDSLTIDATDLDRLLRITCRADVKEPGVTTIPAQSLKAFIDTLPNGCQISMASHDRRADTILLSSGRARASFSTLPAEDYPVMQDVEEGIAYTITGQNLARMLAFVESSMSSETVRWYLCGAFLEVTAGKLTAVATDGHSLATCSTDAPAGSDDAPSVIVPSTAIAEFARMIGASDGEFHLSYDSHKISLSDGRATLISKLIDGSYPDWRRVASKQDGPVFSVSPDEMADAVKRVATQSSGKESAVYMETKDGELLLACGGDHSLAMDSIACEVQTGEPHPVSANSRLLLAALSALGGDHPVNISYAGSGYPIFFDRPDDPERVRIVMPMNKPRPSGMDTLTREA
ncbi:DNA polymerase III subunit beta [Breoghania sp.]|uniref:DNA polymerase III subunit beta n=1 Tax=Breoghania sp. TaxID=2065378 RepID=UPI002AAB6AD7|nr:DNA polymerase III subunit beta [Breoghania sp.]